MISLTFDLCSWPNGSSRQLHTAIESHRESVITGCHVETVHISWAGEIHHNSGGIRFIRTDDTFCWRSFFLEYRINVCTWEGLSLSVWHVRDTHCVPYLILFSSFLIVHASGTQYCLSSASNVSSPRYLDMATCNISQTIIPSSITH